MTITKSPADIAQTLRELSDHMMDVATDLDYYGGMDTGKVSKSQGLIAAAALVMLWVNDFEQEQQ